MTKDIHQHRILILDFGSQYTQLIARRVREIGVYCELWAWDVTEEQIREFNPNGIILSGGPESVTEAGSPRAPEYVFNAGVPVFGICYGMQTMAEQLGGKVQSSTEREFGYAKVEVLGDSGKTSALLRNIEDAIADNGNALLDVWMSHGDKVTSIPADFTTIASTPTCPHAAMANEAKRFYGVQFHPEVTHTRQGARMLEHFVKDICGCECLWTPATIIDDAVARIREQVGDDEVILGLSGGVDSSVVAMLVHRAIGDRLTCVFVDNGLLRLNEGEQVMEMFGDHFGLNIIKVEAEERFLSALAGEDEPEAKRKIIGRVFVEVFDDEAKKLKNARWLAQGTIYPDVIESAASKTGKAHVIKSHHNVGGLPEEMKMGLSSAARAVQRRSAPRWSGTGSALRHALPSPVPGPGSGRARPWRSEERVLRSAAQGRCRLYRRAAQSRPLQPGQPGIRRVPAGALRWRHGRWSQVRLGHCPARRRNHRLYDRPLGSLAVRLPRSRIESHHQRDQRYLPRGVRRIRQAARNHRMGISGSRHSAL